MKRTQFSLSIASSVLACAMAIGAVATASPAVAQDAVHNISVSVPFDFQAGSMSLPAGKYEIDRLSPNVIMLRGTAKNSSELLVVYSATASKAPDHGSVIFHRRGDRYFLSQIWTPGNSTGEQCPTTKAEKALTVAENYQAPTLVELAANVEPHR